MAELKEIFLNAGYYNYVAVEKIMAIINPDSAPVRRLIQVAKKEGNIVDATQGRKTKSVIVLSNKQLLLSAVNPDKLVERISRKAFMEDIIIKR